MQQQQQQQQRVDVISLPPFSLSLFLYRFSPFCLIRYFELRYIVDLTISTSVNQN